MPIAALALVSQPGWVELLEGGGEFTAGDVQDSLQLSRGETLKRLRAAQALGLLTAGGRRGIGGAFYWAPSVAGRRLVSAVRELTQVKDATDRGAAESVGVLAIARGVSTEVSDAIPETDLQAELLKVLSANAEPVEIFAIRVRPMN